MDERTRSRVLRHEYEPPRIVATYSKDDLAEAIRPHGQVAGYQDPGCGGGCGCGCGCGTVIP